MMGNQGHVRIGNPEREEALALLSKQFSNGRLTTEEFSQRCAAVGAAVNRGDLQAVLAGLPGGTTLAREESLAEAIERRVGDANRAAVDKANEQAAWQRVQVSAADELAAKLIELAAYRCSARAQSTGLPARRSRAGFFLQARPRMVSRMAGRACAGSATPGCCFPEQDTDAVVLLPDCWCS